MLNKYKKLSNGVKASIWFMLCSIIQKGIAFITIPIFTRMLTATEYGQYSLFLAWQDIIIIFATLNLNYQVFNNGMVKFKNDKDGYTIAMIGLALISGLITFCLISLFYPLWYKYTGINFISMVMMSINMFCLLIFGLWTVRNRYDYKYKMLTVLTILMAITNPILGIILVKYNTNKVFFRILSIVITSALFGLISFIILFKKSKKIINFTYWKYALFLSIPLIPHYISMVILHSSDRIMIGNIAGENYTALYSVSYNVAVIMQIILNAINASLIPFVYKNIESKNYTNIREKSFSIIVFVACLCLIPMFFAPEAIYILGGKEYLDASSIVPILSVSVYMIFIYSIFVIVEMYFEKSNYIAIGSTCAAVLNVVLNIVFINLFGYKAAAYTTLISYISLAFFHYIMYRKVLNHNNIKENIFNTKILILISIVLFAISIVIYLIYENIVIRYGLFLLLLTLLFIKRKNIINILHSIKTGK